jgi:two-component system cell cycle sensor histidine kinase/response regulator CckA
VTSNKAGIGEAAGLSRSAAQAEDNSHTSASLPAESAVRGSGGATASSSAQPESAVDKELRRLTRALRALSACNQALAQAASEQELLDQICDIIVRFGEYRMAWIGYALPDETKSVKPMARAGHEDQYLEGIVVTYSTDSSGQGPVGNAIRTNQVSVITDTACDPRFAPWRESAMHRGYAAMIALPLRVAGECFGALAIYSSQRGSFESSEVDLLTEMANNLAYGITAIRSHEEGKRATAALREAELKYRQLVEEVPAISYMAEAGAQGPFLYVSPQVRTILGYSPEECLADPGFWWNHLNPKDHPVAAREDTWEEGRPLDVEYRMQRSDGKEVWLRDEFVILRDPASGKRLTRGLLIDITERKRAEEALRRSEENYRLFVAQSSEGIYRTEHNPGVPIDLPFEEQMRLALQSGYVAECNDAMARMYGFRTAEEFTGKRLKDFLLVDDEIKTLVREFIRSGYRLRDWEFLQHDGEGKTRIFRHTMIGIVENGRVVRTWGMQRDETERRHLEEQLRNAQQLEAIGRLAGGVAHDFNNILSIIMGHSELLVQMQSSDARTRNGLEQIRRAADRAASLTQQLLAFGRKQVLLPKVLDLNEAVADVQKMLARVIGEDIELTANLHPSLRPVKADPGQVEQVLMNLAVNARDAMPQGGRLTMETSNVEIDGERALHLELSPGAYVLLKVIDNGHGMDPETLSHIFEPFFTTKPMGKGTGLGLATVYGIVKQSGGSIQVASQRDQGTEFRIYLPAAGHLPQKAQVPSEREDIVGGRETILIAEDESDLRELTCIFLQSYGYKVLTAASAEEAIQLAATYAEPIHLLLTDVIMPGMSGRQLAEKVLAKRPQTRIVYVTGYTDDMVVQHKVLEPGVNLLQKPFTKLELAGKVRSTLDA